MNNLKVSKNIFKKGKMVLLPIAMATIVTLSGCSLIPNGNRARYTNDNSQTDYSYSSVDNTSDKQNTNTTQTITFDGYDIPMKDISEANKTNTKINFTTNNYNSIKNYLDNLEKFVDDVINNYSRKNILIVADNVIITQLSSLFENVDNCNVEILVL